MLTNGAEVSRDAFVDRRCGTTVLARDHAVGKRRALERAARGIGRGIARSIVDDDDLDVAVGLREHGFERSRDVALVVVGRDYDGDPRRDHQRRHHARRLPGAVRTLPRVQRQAVGSLVSTRHDQSEVVPVGPVLPTGEIERAQDEGPRLVVVPPLVADHAQHVQRVGGVRRQRQRVAIEALRLVETARRLRGQRGLHDPLRFDRRFARRHLAGVVPMAAAAMLVALAAAAGTGVVAADGSHRSRPAPSAT